MRLQSEGTVRRSSAMKFYVALDQSSNPIANELYTEKAIEQIRGLPQLADSTIVLVDAPWNNTQWARSGGRQRGGRGVSPYPIGSDIGTIRVPKNIRFQVQQYAVWLANQESFI